MENVLRVLTLLVGAGCIGGALLLQPDYWGWFLVVGFILVAGSTGGGIKIKG